MFLSEHKSYSNWLLSLPFYLLPPTLATSSLGHQGQEVWSGASEHVLHLTSDALLPSHHILHCIKPEASQKLSLQAHFSCVPPEASLLSAQGGCRACHRASHSSRSRLCLSPPSRNPESSYREMCWPRSLQPPPPHVGAHTGWGWGTSG